MSRSKKENIINKLSFPCNIFTWDTKNFPKESLAGVHVVINLAGQNIADNFWTKSYKKEI